MAFHPIGSLKGGWHYSTHAQAQKQRAGLTHQENAGGWGRSQHTRHRGTIVVCCSQPQLCGCVCARVCARA